MTKCAGDSSNSSSKNSCRRSAARHPRGGGSQRHGRDRQGPTGLDPVKLLASAPLRTHQVETVMGKRSGDDAGRGGLPNQRGPLEEEAGVVLGPNQSVKIQPDEPLGVVIGATQR